MKLYHYSAQPLKTLLTLSHQGKTSPELDEEMTEHLGFKYTDHISFFMEPIPKETIHLSFPKDHPVWFEGNTIYEHTIDLLQFSKNPFCVVETPITSTVRERTPDWVSDKIYFMIQDVVGLIELRSGTGYLDLRKAIRKYRGATERAFSKLRTDSHQYAPNVPHIMMECLEKVMVESVSPITIGFGRDRSKSPIYHISFNGNLPSILEPREPYGQPVEAKNKKSSKWWSKENLPPRVSGSPSVEQCFYATYPNYSSVYDRMPGHVIAYVYQIVCEKGSFRMDDKALIKERRVWDAHVTGEHAYFEPVKATKLFKVKILKEDLGDFIKAHPFNLMSEPSVEISPRLRKYEIIERYNEELPALESAKELTWHPNFGPSYTPMEMLNLGVFEGIYTHAIKGIPAKYTNHKKVIGKEGPDESINQFKVKSRQSLKVWQENKWVTKDSPLGWWEWYVKYFEGRRLPEDDWQIGRWRSFVSRHMGQIVAANQTAQLDKRVKQRQGLLQWGWNSTVLVTEVTIRSNAKRLAKLAGASVGVVKTKDKI